MLTVGIDEVGRGCWAGPVVAAAVLLDGELTGVMDSKMLTKSRREAADRLIRAQAQAYGLGWVSAAEVDRVGLTAAVKQAMAVALDAITLPYDEVIIDGSYNFLPKRSKTRALVKADCTIPAVSAASIIAKVARDEYMAGMAKRYPNYGFDKHVGYGTAQHRKNLQMYGVSDIHRRSFKPIHALLSPNDLY